MQKKTHSIFIGRIIIELLLSERADNAGIKIIPILEVWQGKSPENHSLEKKLYLLKADVHSDFCAFA